MLVKGRVIPDTPIAVNLWNTRDYPYAKLFFLTHFHPDHMHGLTSSWSYPIYASTITCKLLENITGINRKHLNCLEIDQPKNIPIDLKGVELLTVSVFDANHCPGAVMILFRGYFGNILYTGDFRFKPGFLDFSLLPNIDVLYIDNKYCSEECSFPTQSEAIDNISQLVHSCLQKSKRIYIGMDDLGKEDLLLKLASETHTKVWVNETKKKFLEMLQFSDIIASEKEEAKFFVVPTKQISSINVDKWNIEVAVCAILPSARYCGFKFQPYSKYDNIHIQPLSNHSSFTELLAFVEKVHPQRVIPIIDKNVKGIFGMDISSRADMSVFDRFLDHERSYSFVVPEVVKKTMDLWSENAQTVIPRKRKISQSRRRSRRIPVSESESHSSEEDSVPAVAADESEEVQHQKDYAWEVIHIPANSPRKLLRIN